MSMVLDRPKNNNNMKVHTNIRRSEIWMADISGVSGSVQSGRERPVVILSNNVGNKYSNICIIAPLSTKPRKPLPTHVEINPAEAGIIYESTVFLEQVRVIDQWQLMYKVGEIDNTKMQEIDRALAISTGLEYLLN